MWEWYAWRRELVSQARPNPGHIALVEMESRLASLNAQFTLITQNVDGLHRHAGSENVIGLTGRVVPLKGYGFIKVFKIAAPDGSIEYWATSNLTLTPEPLADEVAQIWHIEEYHRGLKQFCGVERAQHRRAVAQRNHIGFALRAFLRLECHRLRTGVSWFEAKASIVRDAIRAYLVQPTYRLSTA